MSIGLFFSSVCVQGNYMARNLSTEFAISNAVPVFFYGKWRVDCTMLEKDTQKVVACVRVFAQSLPKIGRG